MQPTSPRTQQVSPIERRKRSPLRAIYGTYLFLWLAGFVLFVYFTDTWDESMPIEWALGILFGKSIAFWLVYAVYRWVTKKRPKPEVPIFCGDCRFYVPTVFNRADGGYEFICHNCRAVNVSLGRAGARVVN